MHICNLYVCQIFAKAAKRISRITTAKNQFQISVRLSLSEFFATQVSWGRKRWPILIDDRLPIFCVWVLDFINAADENNTSVRKLIQNISEL